jgi:hypothetical protein
MTSVGPATLARMGRTLMVCERSPRPGLGWRPGPSLGNGPSWPGPRPRRGALGVGGEEGERGGHHPFDPEGVIGAKRPFGPSVPCRARLAVPCRAGVAGQPALRPQPRLPHFPARCQKVPRRKTSRAGSRVSGDDQSNSYVASLRPIRPWGDQGMDAQIIGHLVRHRRRGGDSTVEYRFGVLRGPRDGQVPVNTTHIVRTEAQLVAESNLEDSETLCASCCLSPASFRTTRDRRLCAGG